MPNKSWWLGDVEIPWCDKCDTYHNPEYRECSDGGSFSMEILIKPEGATDDDA